jgi:hypothetical protein
MARKRDTGSDPVVSGGAAPVRVRRTSRKTAVDSPPDTSISSEINAQSAPAQTAETAFPVAVVENGKAPSYDTIAKLAHSYWEARGCQGGSPEEDWLRAEQELRSFHSSARV